MKKGMMNGYPMKLDLSYMAPNTVWKQQSIHYGSGTSKKGYYCGLPEKKSILIDQSGVWTMVTCKECLSKHKRDMIEEILK